MSDEPLRLKPGDVLWREVDDEVIGLSLSRAEYVTTNESARELWRLLAEGTTLRELAAALERGYGIDAERARVDAAAFVAQLRERGLLE
jgi:hypothetical protein